MYTGIQASWMNILSHCLTRVWPQTGISPVKETASHVSPLNDPSLITCQHNTYIVNKGLCQNWLQVIELQAIHTGLGSRLSCKFNAPPDIWDTSQMVMMLGGLVVEYHFNNKCVVAGS